MQVWHYCIFEPCVNSGHAQWPAPYLTLTQELLIFPSWATIVCPLCCFMPACISACVWLLFLGWIPWGITPWHLWGCKAFIMLLVWRRLAGMTFPVLCVCVHLMSSTVFLSLHSLSSPTLHCSSLTSCCLACTVATVVYTPSPGRWAGEGVYSTAYTEIKLTLYTCSRSTLQL